jgi:S-formylglutathione hydrolase
MIFIGRAVPELLIDVGNSDPFLEEQLKPELLRGACADAGIPLTLRMQEGYDHSYYFVSTFMEDHLRWHHERLTR